jgi:signal transduction histidine kinase
MSSVASLQPQRNGAANLFGQVAHELRQPLSNIESIAYYLTLVLPRNDAKVQDQLTRIRQLVEQSNWILSSGLRLAAAVPPTPGPLDFDELITEVVSGSSHQNLRLELAGNLPLLSLDRRQGCELVDTLLMLVRPLASVATPATLRTSAAAGSGVVLEVLVVLSEVALGSGSELFIESARQIAQAHGGELACERDPASGFRVRVMLP